jgi:hypothetical protein
MDADASLLPMIIYDKGEALDFSPRLLFTEGFAEDLTGQLESAKGAFIESASERQVSSVIATRWFADTQRLLEVLKGCGGQECPWADLGDLAVRLYTLSYVISEASLSSEIDILDLLLSADELRVKKAVEEQRAHVPTVSGADVGARAPTGLPTKTRG